MVNQSNSKTDRTFSFGAMVGIAVVPVLITIGLLFMSPNYQEPNAETEQPLSYPLGGDYLQEHVGGQLILNPTTRNKLYDSETFKSAQHEHRRLGFSWDENQFFLAVYPPFWYSVVSPLTGLPYLVASRVWLCLMTIA